MSTTQNSLAGEFAVLSQLYLNGYDANLTLGNTKGVDILVSNPLDNKMYKLEVKTQVMDKKPKNEIVLSAMFGKFMGGWVLQKSHEDIIDPNLFYCFVRIYRKDNLYRYYIVPSEIVARYVKAEHKFFKQEKDKRKEKFSDTAMGQFRLGVQGEKYSIETPLIDKYENNWKFTK